MPTNLQRPSNQVVSPLTVQEWSKRGRRMAISLIAFATLTTPSIRKANGQEIVTPTSEWKALFNGSSLEGWTTVSGKPVTKGWEVVDGELHLSVAGDRGGSIVTDREYTNFELHFSWRIAPGGNNGIKYRVREYDGRTLGLEYQIIDDDGHKSKLKPLHRTGSIYDLYDADPSRFLRPAGEYNDSRIVVRDGQIEHWLNGQQVAFAQVGTDDWMQRVAKSKFAEREGFGQYRTGKIMLTDHNSEVWFRYVVLREL